MFKEDTIAAIATAPGEGGIGIVRISGESAEAILRSLFIPANKLNKEKEYLIENRKLTYGRIVDPKTGEAVDEVLAVMMKGPYTYTTEDVVEINCHGSMVSLKKTLELVLRSGARLAEPGEFTKRAFLNGRIDLSQAEAVIDLIKSKTEASYKAAMGQLSGRLSEEINNVRQKIVDVLVDLAVNIDYPDEDIEIMTYEKIEGQLQVIEKDLKELSDTGYTGRILREGLNTVIVGKPNVGKSSLMNRLLRETRSIVTEIPGTTRDTIEEQLNIGGILLNITDTAGIRETEDTVEKIGVEKSLNSLKRADLVLFIMDLSRTVDEEDMEIIKQLEGKEEVIVLLNKADKDKKFGVSDLKPYFEEEKIIITSMENGTGLKELEDRIQNMVYEGKVRASENVLITNVRHLNLINKALNSVQEALISSEDKQPFELIEIDVNEAWACLGEITGEAVREDIIDEVFARFCLGK
ncbi:MAG: tRNA uridine-5-carboxymethylaminomethyl(34) synthesis GTPase MnmE [Firmicutes bacterium]|nr:tRNA uridine-5-carboxymethylaminomethyl(34) synthesis GTPase MnmE [Bacillota bacterium]